MMDVSQMAQLWLDSQSFGIGGKSQRDYFQQIINEHVEKETGKNDSGNDRGRKQESVSRS